MSVAALLNKTCTIRPRTTSKGAVTGSTVYTNGTDVDNVPCKVDVMSARQRGGPAQAGETEYNVFFAYGQTVAISSLILNITGMVNATLEVTSEVTDDAGRGAYARVTAVHRVGGGVR